jgi:uncharacterized membrane protein/predicted DsbA family dithiol-disulfide isomerase
MRPSRVLDVAAVLSAVIGLGASLTALVDDLGAAPTFCSATGCELVRASAWARPLGVPMSALGVAFFAFALVLTVIAAPRLRLVLAVAGALWASWLIGLQAWKIGAFCKLCMVADPAAILHGVLVAAGAGAMTSRRWRMVWAVPATVAVIIGLGTWVRAPALPASSLPTATVAPGSAAPSPAEAAPDAAPGTVTIVDFVDFECPFCRALQQRLDEAIAIARVPTRVVRKMVPLAQHPHALPAALAWCCADVQGYGDAMAAALFAAEPEALTPQGCEAIAQRLGCDLARYRRDLPQMMARIERDGAEAKAAHVEGLPTLFIGGERLTGAGYSSAELAARIERAAKS